jgi:hypothetical protein
MLVDLRNVVEQRYRTDSYTDRQVSIIRGVQNSSRIGAF